MNKQPEVTAITKENLTNAFWSLYKSKRIEKITVKEITSIAGYNRSTFYEYFNDVYSVLEYIEDSLLNYMKEDVMKDLNFLDDDAVIKKITDLFIAKGEYFSMFLGEDGDPYFAGKLKAMLKPVAYSALPIEEVGTCSTYIFEFVMSAVLGTIIHWYKVKDDIPLNDIIIMNRSILSRGVLNEMQNHLR